MVSRLKDTLLLVGDASSDRPGLRKIFESAFNLLEAENSAQALMLLEPNIDCIAGVLADLPLSDSEGISAISTVLRNTKRSAPFLLFLTHSGTGKQEEAAFRLGVTDVVYKPYTPEGVQRRLQILIDIYLHKLHLETLVAEQSETIINSKQVVMDALSAIIEHRSSESGNHVLRIRRFTQILLEEVAESCPEYNLTPEAIDAIASASTLHDIGKISIPDNVLNKPGRLTPEEFELMKTHTTVGGELVLTLDGIASENELRYAYNIALYHHERWDGKGYPAGLEGDDIPICAQVVSIADVFDALTSHRVYKPAYEYSKALNMILNGECGVFSPKLLACFKNVRNQFVELAHKYADGYSPKSDKIAVPLPGPTRQKAQLNTLELAQVKYSALLHYTNATVIEADLGSRLYHVVYNPNPEFRVIPDISVDIFEYLAHNATFHPDDKELADSLQQYYETEFFPSELHRRTFRLRIYSPYQSRYIPYEFTTLRINTQVKEQRTLLIIIRRTEDNSPQQTTIDHTLRESPALLGLTDSVLRCFCNKDMTIDAGADSLFALTGYSAEEIARDLGGSYVRLVHPADRSDFIAATTELIASGGSSVCEYRILCKDGSSVWVQDKFRFYTEENGQDYVYHSVSDNSRAREDYEKYQYAIARNQLIIDQSGGIIFEWDMANDTMYCSPKWEEHFGYKPVSRNYGQQMGIATHFHADDLPIVRGAIEQIKNNADTLCIDVRIADSNAKYLWTRITATAYLDKNGRLSRIIGMLQDVDALKRAELALRERAELDSLTKLLNKDSSHRLITERLENRDKDRLSALLVIDLDNFKQVNDNFGHLYGDEVLAQVGSKLKNIFRDNDIISRIGGDEFLVFMDGIPSSEQVERRCRLMLSTFHSLFEQIAPELNVSLSIGVALVPEHGTNYTDLFRRADEALYTSKSLGKNTYVFYTPEITLPTSSEHISTRIDSDEQPGMADSSFVRYVFRRLYESSDLMSSVDSILSYVGQQLNVSRVYIFENNDDNTACSNTFEWCNEGISPEKDFLQNVSYITDIPGWPEVYDERGVFYCTDISSLAPQFRNILEPQGIKSMLQCAIRDNGVFRGYVGFDECHVNRLWTQEQINLLEFLSDVLALFLLKQRNQEKALALSDSLRTILDMQDEWLYVIDPETCEIKFLNAKSREIAPRSEIGMPCYKAFMSRSSQCENCPARNLHGGKSEPVPVASRKLGCIVNTTAAEINWNGKKAFLITCRQLPDPIK